MKRTFILRSQEIRDALIKFIDANFWDMAKTDAPMTVTCGEHKKTRTNDQNAAMWAGILQPLADQVWVHGRRYTPEIWHDYLKQKVIPEMIEEEPESGDWVKDPNVWDYMPNGDRVFIGSTTKLTKSGMAQYMLRIEAFAVAEMGVKLPANPKER